MKIETRHRHRRPKRQSITSRLTPALPVDPPKTWTISQNRRHNVVAARQLHLHHHCKKVRPSYPRCRPKTARIHWVRVRSQQKLWPNMVLKMARVWGSLSRECRLRCKWRRLRNAAVELYTKRKYYNRQVHHYKPCYHRRQPCPLRLQHHSLHRRLYQKKNHPSPKS